MTAIALPSFLQRRIESEARSLIRPPGNIKLDFRHPAGAPALAGPDSVSWRVFKNPVTLFVGGVAAVLMEFAEPRVRAGVWRHSSFRTDPVARLRRTGFAAMVTVYAPSESAEKMIAGVTAAHARVSGVTETGQLYSALDTDLLNWVQVTAAYGFLEAYHRHAAPLTPVERDTFFAEGEPAARLYGATGAPTSEAGWQSLLEEMDPRFGPSRIIDEFLALIREAPVLPAAARPLQTVMVKAAIDLLPDRLRDRLEISARLRPLERLMLRTAARTADRLPLHSAPPAQASLRMGRPADFLYRG
ncbi:DUF2236 domain-containing protein [Pseudohoeflea suaedae]|uniref:DUF2236 domain-containing protein n=1 Tax=Pseudohoeflea suaedae TaxID=877384 RepID=A0A4V3A6U5_9HYPH|nr:oxygenase MpaB family protein [Pseudohoeflea suaedae]TDH34229.1 DUF2236 domain-containing protein [Pseudohoeflea suaedae]